MNKFDKDFWNGAKVALETGFISKLGFYIMGASSEITYNDGEFYLENLADCGHWKDFKKVVESIPDYMFENPCLITKCYGKANSTAM